MAFRARGGTPSTIWAGKRASSAGARTVYQPSFVFRLAGVPEKASSICAHTCSSGCEQVGLDELMLACWMAEYRRYVCELQRQR